MFHTIRFQHNIYTFLLYLGFLLLLSIHKFWLVLSLWDYIWYIKIECFHSLHYITFRIFILISFINSILKFIFTYKFLPKILILQKGWAMYFRKLMFLPFHMLQENDFPVIKQMYFEENDKEERDILIHLIMLYLMSCLFFQHVIFFFLV